jgi:hypothetical protein
MNGRPLARVTDIPMPQLDPDTVRVEVDCRCSTTGITSIPGPRFAPTRAQQVTAAVFEREARCGACDTSEAHQQGDRTIRDRTERVWAAMKQARARRYLDEVRN